MEKALFILGELTDDDFDWMLTNGSKEEIPAGTILIQQGNPIDKFYIVLGGDLGVFMGSAEGPVIAHLSSGEVVGEMSFLDARPPSATVKAIADSLVWSIPRKHLVTKLHQDVGFASRFYRALAVFLCDRLRGTVSRLGYDPDQSLSGSESEAEINPSVLDNLDLAQIRFSWLLRRLLLIEN
ncbi:cyclic nucleotide-binding protein [Neosynechococcus sphagnicola sy1]|uniref:Cyclic nucleotide-binding protein n=1 Tax=Neosynechococcus sphagnicola sy1 TaxID=1497020 RepID=A0A098TJJ7_9CYAN|nr:cyclic nucleotide-binding domain-containing protein [Neosynechococcus sphagnicola]KGF72346.1 cyclic nucleotide-binding protein [Neosynechococcus sphagnicola sy1]